MANRNSGGRARSRKRRPAAASSARPRAAGGETSELPSGGDPGRLRRESPPSAGVRDGGRPARAAGSQGRFRDPQSLGERPQAPWHPAPLSELLILVGGIGVLVALARGPQSNAPTLFAGIGAVMIGTVEVTLREHRSGYRSHTLLLSALPVIALHSIVILSVAAFTRVPRALNVGLLALDAALFALLFRLLRARFSDARRERTFTAARR